MGWERELYFKSGDPSLLTEMWPELMISDKVTYPPCNFTSFPSCYLAAISLRFCIVTEEVQKGLGFA